MNSSDVLARQRNHVISCIAIFFFASLSVFPFFRLNVNRSEGDIWQVSLVWLALSLAYGLVSCGLVTLAVGARERSWLRFLLPSLFLLVAVSRALFLFGSQDFNKYGDSLSFFVPDNEDMGRWLLSYAVVREVFDGVNALLFDIAPVTFVRLSGSTLMLAWSCWIIARRESSVTPWLIMLSPIWVLLSVGHDEIYPFVAGLTIAVLWQIFSGQQIFDRNTNYIIAGVLPALYIGTAPASLALIIFTWGLEHDLPRRIKGVVVAAISFAVAVEVGGDFKGYFKNLVSDIGFNGFVRYPEGGLNDNPLATTGSRSVFTPASYAFSWTHLLDIVFWLVCGTGLLVLIWVLVESRTASKRRATDVLAGSVRPPFFIRLARVVLVGSAVLFLIFMLPGLGPTADIDLYFWSMFVILLIAGLRLDRRLVDDVDLRLSRARLVQVFALGFAPVTTALVVFGVARY